MGNLHLKQFAALILCISLSVVGALLKFPTHLGSIALDSAPALVAGVLLGKKEGALVAAVGHLLSAWFAGFQLGAFHGLIALEMAVLVYIFSLLFHKGWRKTAHAAFFIGNVFLAPLPLIFSFGGMFIVAVLPALAIATALNAAICFIVAPVLLKTNILDRGKMHNA
ncbi:ECF transporter S component [Anoxybacillus rupiensis]|uniref:ECF transporter S component n=1 Tax=Anoxybacteroides rupiense TaxID=311460 RepID=UPI001BA68170|nr:ECF transporter S component [Anoxybacillus rupiensis]MBS2770207.1 ECF transporter S component [Anoxybacillus rupiensis]